MRLSVRGRLIHAALAIVLASALPRHLAEGEWIGVALGALGLVLFGVPALLGRNPMVDPSAVSRWARWIYAPGEQPHRGSGASAGGGRTAGGSSPAP